MDLFCRPSVFFLAFSLCAGFVVLFRLSLHWKATSTIHFFSLETEKAPGTVFDDLVNFQHGIDPEREASGIV